MSDEQSEELFGQLIVLNRRLIPKPAPVIVNYCIQNTKPGKPNPLPEGVSIVPFRVRGTDGNLVGQSTTPSSTVELTAEQFKALYKAVAAQSGWVPPEGLEGNEFIEQFGNCHLHALVENGKTIGFASAEGNYNGNPNHAGLNYIGVIPSKQGQGYGSRFLDHMLEKAWNLATIQDGIKHEVKAVQLDTVPTHDRARNGVISASDIYARKGFVLDVSRGNNGTEEKSYDTNPDSLQEQNLPGAYQYEVYQAIKQHDSAYNHVPNPTEVAEFYTNKLRESGIDQAVAKATSPASPDAQPETVFAADSSSTTVGAVTRCNNPTLTQSRNTGSSGPRTAFVHTSHSGEIHR